MNSVEILNYYRNLYHCEPTTTEQGIVAWAINDILPTYVNKTEIHNKAFDEFAVKIKNFIRSNIEDAEYFGDGCCEIYESEIDEILEQMKESV